MIRLTLAVRLLLRVRILNQTASLYIASQVKCSMVMLLFRFEKSIAFAMQANLMRKNALAGNFAVKISTQS